MTGPEGLVGVLLLAFGGPDTPEAIEPFLTNLMGGRKPAPEALARAKERYRLIGGRSPLLDLTRAQAIELERILNREEPSFLVRVGMRYWHPFIGEALAELAAQGVSRVVAVSLSPHFSRVSTGAYEQEIAKALASPVAPLPVSQAAAWYEHPLFIAALREKVLAAWQDFPPERRQGVQIIFSAHSLPLSHIRGGDPYVVQLNSTVRALVEKLGCLHWHLAYQSKGLSPGEWLGPDVEEVMEGLAALGERDVLVVPVSFVADHVETLYDIDMVMRKKAAALGLNFGRSQTLNTSPLFLEALASVIRREVDR